VPLTRSRSRPAPLTSPRFEAIVEAPIKSGKVAGASVVVARQGQTILSESFGKADLELDVPMPADASFEIGSVTKQFTQPAILLLVERGKLGLDDELTKYLPDYPTQRPAHHHPPLAHAHVGIKGYTELPEFGI
jgi:CubicO group peptidase (beta-lactamase class C family)